MSIEVKIPAVGESITSGVVSVWHKKSGDFVNEGEALFTLETEADEGQEVKIGEIVATIDDSKPPPEEKKTEKRPEKKKEPEAEKQRVEEREKKTPPKKGEPLSPAVRRIIEEEHLEPEKISGTGKAGRLTKADALAAAQNRGAAEEKVEPPSRGYGGPSIAEDRSAEGGNRRGEQSADGRFVRKKMSPLRRKIAAQLVMAQHTAAILTTFNECDMSAV